MVFLELVNHEELYSQASDTVIFANDLEVDTKEAVQKLNNLLYKRYEGDSLNVLPSCDCGSLKGGYNIGVKCNNCNTFVVSSMERPLESMIWIKAPEGVDTLINPAAWVILSNQMTTNGFNFLEWLCNPLYKAPTNKIPPKLSRYEQLGIPRGLNSFYQNFDVIMSESFRLRLIKEQGPLLNDVKTWIAENREKIFTRYLPMPSKLGFVVESATTVSYADKTITLAIDALRTIVSVENSVAPLSVFRRQIRVVKSISKLAEYYKTFTNKTLGSKPGIFRRHVFGGRLHFSARAVISSISVPHNYDEVHLPWSLALQLLRLHVISKLRKRINPWTSRIFTPVEMDILLRDSALQYNALLDEIFKEIINESPHGGIPCTFGRNPTLARGSIQVLFITKIKTDISDTTISWSLLVLTAANADFDGDEMNIWLIPDHATYRKLSRLAPHLYALDMYQPRKISGYLKLPAPVVQSIGNWLDEDE